MSSQFQKPEQLLEFAAVLSEQNDFREILRLVVQKAATLIDAEIVLLLMLNPQTRQTIKTIFKDGKEIRHDRYRLVQINVCGWVFNHKQPILIRDLKNDERFDKNQFEEIQVKSVIAAPLKVEGGIIGCLLLINHTSGGEFKQTDLDLLKNLSAIASPYLRNVQMLRDYFAAALPQATLLSKYETVGLLGKSQKFVELLLSIEAAARCDVRVLLEGQTGTGKELIARAIHWFSPRSEQKFLTIDCGAIPESLLESELFGYTKGAFTGASRDRKGMFEEADGGTLFMDEIGNLPMPMQAKLMRVLQEGEVRPLGSNTARNVDVRIICATSSSLREQVDAGLFRDDLFYRLHIYPIHIPSLNERRKDIALLANHFLNKFVSQQHKHANSFHATLLNFMQQRRWAGNIRELENFVERMITLASPNALVITSQILPDDLKDEFETFRATKHAFETRKSLSDSLREYEAQLIKKALIECDWNQSQAARMLKISERNIRFKMEKLGIKKPV